MKQHRKNRIYVILFIGISILISIFLVFSALQEMERVSKAYKYLCVESYKNEEEKANLLYWQVTCEAFNTPDEWKWWFRKTSYNGDYSFIYFE